jgi:fermentation-respiration switch protein FrsA (DUF1100 family)
MGTVTAVLGAAYAGITLLLFAFQSQLVFVPEAGREIIASPDRLGMAYEDVRLETADGLSLHGWYVPATQPRGTVLFLHGNGGNISHRLDSLLMFHRMGYNTLIFDYRGYAANAGKPTEEGTYLDADAAWRYLAEQKHTPSCRIVLFGESMGAAIAARLATREKPAALVISSGFTSVPDMAQHLYPYLPARWLAYIRYDTRSYLKSVTAPVFVAHSPQDDIVPYEQGQALYAAANQPKQFLELAGGHNEGFIFMRAEWVAALRDFLSKQVEAVPCT